MVIDRIGNINRIVNTDKTQSSKTKEVKSSATGDTVSISAEAQKAQDVARIKGMVKETSDVREDRIKAVRDKLEAGAYDGPDNEILERVAEKIAQNLTR